MKRFQRLIVFVMLACCFFMLAACKPPQTRDTSAVAGTYRQSGKPHIHIELHADGTWSAENDAKLAGTDRFGTFKLTDNNTKISVYSGKMEVMKGTIEGSTLTLSVWQVLWWEEGVVFIKG